MRPSLSVSAAQLHSVSSSRPFLLLQRVAAEPEAPPPAGQTTESLSVAVEDASEERKETTSSKIREKFSMMNYITPVCSKRIWIGRF